MKYGIRNESEEGGQGGLSIRGEDAHKSEALRSPRNGQDDALAGTVNRPPFISGARSLRVGVGRDRDHAAKDGRRTGATRSELPPHAQLRSPRSLARLSFAP